MSCQLEFKKMEFKFKPNLNGVWPYWMEYKNRKCNALNYNWAQQYEKNCPAHSIVKIFSLILNENPWAFHVEKDKEASRAFE